VEKGLLVAHQIDLCVAHMLCATIATPSQYAPRIVYPSVTHIPYAPLTDYVWRIWLYAPLMPDAQLAMKNMRH
jgi:hypothetical protein